MSAFRDFWYRSFDQLRLYARDYPGPEKADAPTLVCLPGLTRNSADFEDLCALLCEDYRILAADLRGRGRSAADPEPGNYHPVTYARDVSDLLQAAGVEQAVFIGTSLGGLVSMTVAAGNPACVSGIVLNDVGPELNPEGVARIREYLTDYRGVDDWQQAVARTRTSQGAALPDLSEADWDRFTRRLYREDASRRPVLNYDRDIAVLFEAQEPGTPSPDLWPMFGLLTGIPMLVLRGAHSDILSADTVAIMQQRHPRLQAVQVANRGHAPLLDEPDAVTAIRAFLTSVQQPLATS